MEVCQTKAGCSNIAYPLLVLRLMPDGARGLMMAVMMAALMSDLDSIFNSTSTLFTLDIWKRMRKRASNIELMVVGRIFIFVMVAVSMSWVQVIKENQKGQIFMYMQEVTNYVAPPLGVIYVLGVLFPFVNETGAFWSLMLAFLMGMIRLFSALILKGQEHCGSVDEYPEPPIVKNFQYMYFSMFTTSLTAVSAITISLLTGRPDDKLLFRTTFWTRFRKGQIKSEEWGSTDSESIEEDCVKNRIQLMTSESILKKAFSLFCGLHHTSQDEEKIAAMKAHLEKISKLEQKKWEKIILNISFVIIVTIGVIMYVFWSVYDFDTAPFYPEGAVNLLPGDSLV